MNTFFGIPAHPLFVHLPVVLIPLASIAVVAMLIRPKWWDQFKWATLLVAGVGAFGAIISTGSGEQLEESVEGTASRKLLHAHAEAGESARTMSVIFFVILLTAIVIVPWIKNRRASTPRWLASVVSALLVLSAFAASWTIYDAGHSGAKSVWSQVKLEK